MAKRKAKKNTKQSPSQLNNSQCNADPHTLPEDNTFFDQEVEVQKAAIKTIRDVEIERLLTSIRLLKSNISNEQLQTPLLQFFDENLPNLTVSRTEKTGPIEVKLKENSSMITTDGGNMIPYFLQHLSMANTECHNLQMKDFVVEEPSDTHIFGAGDSMQTPGVSSARLSVGMTPKSLRLPKQGEMLLSVHGSPLGVYKENMDAIHETEEG